MDGVARPQGLRFIKGSNGDILAYVVYYTDVRDKELIEDAVNALNNKTPVVQPLAPDERAAFRRLLEYAESRLCLHEETHRRGTNWEVCNQCGVKWADDEGGKPEFAWPLEIEDARLVLDADPKLT